MFNGGFISKTSSDNETSMWKMKVTNDKNYHCVRYTIRRKKIYTDNDRSFITFIKNIKKTQSQGSRTVIMTFVCSQKKKETKVFFLGHTVQCDRKESEPLGQEMILMETIIVWFLFANFDFLMTFHYKMKTNIQCQLPFLLVII